jgi:hypothetical protein
MHHRVKQICRAIPIASVLVGSIVVALFSGCAMHDPDFFEEFVINGQAIEVHSQQDTVTIAWDPPATPVQAYRIYYREHGDVVWIYLDEVSATGSPEYVLHISQFGEGSYDFGVSAVDPSDTESDIHTSLDITADPTTGWYLNWSP